MLPRVSVYWISLNRARHLARAVQSFRESTNYPNVEAIVVDCSPPDSAVRSWIKHSTVFDRVILRDAQACIWNNANLAFEHCSGEYILHLENDVEFLDSRPTWLHEAIDELRNDPLLAISLAEDDQSTEPHSLGFITSRRVREQWHPWKCHPINYPTISMSIDQGDRDRKARFAALGFRAKGMLLLRHDLSAPSLNLTKLHRLYGIDYEILDQAMQEGVNVIRRPDAGYTDFPSYLSFGSWQACEWRLSSEDGGPPPDDNVLRDVLPANHPVVARKP